MRALYQFARTYKSVTIFFIVSVILGLTLSVLIYPRLNWYSFDYESTITEFFTCEKGVGDDEWIAQPHFQRGTTDIFACGHIVNHTPDQEIVFNVLWRDMSDKQLFYHKMERFFITEGQFVTQLEYVDLSPGRYEVFIQQGRDILATAEFWIK